MMEIVWIDFRINNYSIIAKIKWINVPMGSIPDEEPKIPVNTQFARRSGATVRV